MKWLVRTLGALVALALLATALLYGASGWALRRDREVPLQPLTADTSVAGIAEGARLARINGCMSCHAGGHGRLFITDPKVALLSAPAFASFVPEESDAQIARSIRQGVDGGGRQLFIMPSHRWLADDDTARIVGYLRTLKPSPADVPRQRSFGPLGRLAILTGGLRESQHPALAGGPHRDADSGRYFAQSVCLGCHQLYQPSPVGPKDIAPPLAMIAASYDDAAFLRLLRTGRGLSKPDLGLMTEVAKGGLDRLSDGEIVAIHAYLRKQADKPPAQDQPVASP